MITFSRFISTTAILATLGLGTTASAVSFNYSSGSGATINFAGNSTFSFTTTPDSFHVTSGSALGSMGDITGTFTIGAVAGNSAPVTGTGSFIIHGPGGDLTANLSWATITQFGSGDGLNTLAASVNLSNIVYAGTNADLVALRNDGWGINTLTFQFVTNYSLNDFKTQALSNSFSGTVTSSTTPTNTPGVPDGGLTLAMFGVALIGLALARKLAPARSS